MRRKLLLRMLIPVVSVVSVVSVGAERARAAPPHLVVLTSDGFSGSVSAMELTEPWTPTTGLEPIAAHAVVRHRGGLHYVVNGSPQDEVQAIDPDTWETVSRIPTGAGSDPQDIVFADGEKAFVSAGGGTHVLVVDLGTAAVVDSVDLSAFADADGVPDLGRLAIDGARVFVQVRRLAAPGAPVAPSMLAVIDAATNALIDADSGTPGTQAIELTGLDPVNDMQIDGSFLYVMEQGDGDIIDVHGGIDAVDLTTLQAAGFLTTEVELGGHTDSFILVSPKKGYAVTHTDLTLSSHLIRFSRLDGRHEGAVLEVIHTRTSELAHDPETGLLYFPVMTIDPGVRVVDTATDAVLTPSSVAAGPAVDVLAVRRTGTTAAPLAARESVLRVGVARPNPFRRASWIPLSIDRAASVTLSVFDAAGRRVLVQARELSAGDHRLSWDGRDGAGAPAASGTYFLRVTSHSGAATGRVVLLR